MSAGKPAAKLAKIIAHSAGSGAFLEFPEG